MDNLLSHTRVLAHLSRFSLQPRSIETQRQFYVILDKTVEGREYGSTKLQAIASAFGCKGFIIVGESHESKRNEQTDDQVTTIYVKSFEEARDVIKQTFRAEIVGVLTQPLHSVEFHSTFLGHPKAFPRSATFLFLTSKSSDEKYEICDRFVHLASSSGPTRTTSGEIDESLGLDSCASITLHRFMETRGEYLISEQIEQTIENSTAAVSKSVLFD